MANLEELLSTHWQMTTTNIKSVGPVWRIETPEGTFCLKRGKHGIPRFHFHHHAIETLWNNGYSGTPRLLPTKTGRPFAETAEGAFALIRWVGRPLDATSLHEWKQAARQLALFHEASVGMTLPTDLDKKYFSGKWLKRFPERHGKLQEIIAMFHPPKNEFEQAFLRQADTILQLSDQANQRLQNSQYAQLVQDIALRPLLVHGNVKSENFTVNEQGEVSIIDFDSFRLDVPVQDLSDLLSGALPALNWSLEDAIEIFNAYHQTRPLSQGEQAVLLALLTYPHAAFKIGNKYVTQGLERRPLHKWLQKWQLAEQSTRDQQEFLRKWANWLKFSIN